MDGRNVRSVIPIVLAVGFLAAIVPFGARPAIEACRLAYQLRSVPVPERKVFLIGAWVRDVERLRRATPAGSSIDLVMIGPEARDLAVLSAAMLQPRDCRIFAGWEAWRKRERAHFLQGTQSANAPPGLATPPAQVVVALDVSDAQPFRAVERPR